MSEFERFARAHNTLAQVGSSWRKQRMRDVTDDLVDDALHYGDAAVTRVPTMLSILCPACGRTKQIKAFIDRPLKLRCRKCGCRDPIVQGREPLRSWARRRR